MEVVLAAINTILSWLGIRTENYRKFCEERMPPIEEFVDHTSTYLDMMRNAIHNHGIENLGQPAIDGARQHSQHMMLALAPLLYDSHTSRDAIDDKALTETFTKVEQMGAVCRFMVDAAKPGQPAKFIIEVIDEAQGHIKNCRKRIKKLLT
jgi:hypothetical protein